MLKACSFTITSTLHHQRVLLTNFILFYSWELFSPNSLPGLGPHLVHCRRRISVIVGYIESMLSVKNISLMIFQHVVSIFLRLNISIVYWLLKQKKLTKVRPGLSQKIFLFCLLIGLLCFYYYCTLYYTVFVCGWRERLTFAAGRVLAVGLG